MPSLADIPNHLLERGRLMDFLDWVTKIPVTYNVRICIANIWSTHTGRKLEREHRDFIQRHSFRDR